jgi:hypothetical protein
MSNLDIISKMAIIPETVTRSEMLEQINNAKRSFFSTATTFLPQDLMYMVLNFLPTSKFRQIATISMGFYKSVMAFALRPSFGRKQQCLFGFDNLKKHLPSFRLYQCLYAYEAKESSEIRKRIGLVENTYKELIKAPFHRLPFVESARLDFDSMCKRSILRYCLDTVKRQLDGNGVLKKMVLILFKGGSSTNNYGLANNFNILQEIVIHNALPRTLQHLSIKNLFRYDRHFEEVCQALSKLPRLKTLELGWSLCFRDHDNMPETEILPSVETRVLRVQQPKGKPYFFSTMDTPTNIRRGLMRTFLCNFINRINSTCQ